MDEITITQSRYEELLKAEEFLSILEHHGIHNWEGYEYACKDMEDSKEESE